MLLIRLLSEDFPYYQNALYQSLQRYDTLASLSKSNFLPFVVGTLLKCDVTKGSGAGAGSMKTAGCWP